MSDSSNVWDAGDAATDVSGAAGAGSVKALGPETNELPPVADMFMATIEDFKENWADHGMVGLGMLLILIPAVSVFMLVGFVPYVAAIISEDIALIFAGLAWLMVSSIVGMALVMGPVMYALFSIENSYLEGDTEALGLGGFFSRLGERPVGAIGYHVSASGLGMVGVLFFIIGAFIVQIALSMALPAMVVHKMGVVAAITRSASHVKDHFVWHLGFWGLGFVVVAIAGNIPFVGYAFGMPFFANYMLRGYRAVFGGMDSDYAAY